MAIKLINRDIGYTTDIHFPECPFCSNESLHIYGDMIWCEYCDIKMKVNKIEYEFLD